MENYTELPIGYSEICNVDLKNDKKKALLVNGISLLIIIPMFVIGAFIAPFKSLFNFGIGMTCVLLVGVIVYMLLHELVYRICIKHFSGMELHDVFTGFYDCVGSDTYFIKRDYIIIALAPVVVWGIVLLVLNFVLPMQWFWCVYFIQIYNISCASGDIYVACKFSKMPADILVQNDGKIMRVYSREAPAKQV